MWTKTVSISLFLFYFLFVVSYFEVPSVGLFRFVGMGILMALFLIAASREGIPNTKNIKVFLFLNYLLLFSLAVVMVFSSFKFDSLVKFLSLAILFSMTFFVIPTLIDKVGLISHNKAAVLGVFSGLILSYLLNPDRVVFTGDRLGVDVRLILSFDHPNTLGLFCFIVIILGLYNLFAVKRGLISFVYIFAIAVAGFFLYQSNSRTAIYSIIVFLIIYVLRWMLNSFIKRVLFSMFLLTFFVILSFFTEFDLSYDRLNQLLSNRLDYWTAGLYQVRDDIWTGIGSFTNSSISTLDLVLLDNGYLSVLYQNGVIVLGLLLLKIIAMYLVIRKSKGKELLFTQVLLVAFLFFSFFENSLYNLSNLLCVMVFGIGYYAIKQTDKKEAIS